MSSSGEQDGSSGERDAGIGSDASDAAPHNLDFFTCATASKCGTTPVGSWRFKSACIVDVLGPSRSQCATMVASNVRGTTTGTLTITGTGVTRDLRHEIDLDLALPSACTGGFDCPLVGAGLGTLVPGASGTCVAAGPGGANKCNCAVHVSRIDQLQPSGYSFDAGHLATMGNDAGEQFDTCAKVDGGSRALLVSAPDHGISPAATQYYVLE